MNWDDLSPTPPSTKAAAPNWDDLSPAPPQRGGSDVKTAFVQGIKEVPGAITGLADIPAGLVGLNRPFSRAADAVGEAIGFQPSKYAKADEAKYSDKHKAQKSEIDAIEKDPNKGFKDMAEFYAKNPEYTGLNIVRSLPSMVLGGVYGRALKGIGGSAVARGAAGEGAVMAGQQMEGIDKNVDPQRAAAAAVATGTIGAGIGALGGRIAQKAGIADVNTLLAGGGRGTGPVDLVKRGIIGRSATGLGQEGAEELGQSLTEQGAKNLAEEKPFTQGMMRAGIEGTLAGSAMGAGAGVISRSRSGETAVNANPTEHEEPADEAAQVAQEAMQAAPEQQPQPTQDMPAPPAGNPLIEQQQAEQEQEARAQAAKAKRDALISKVGGVVPIAGTNMSLFNGKPYHNDDPDGALDKQIAKLQEAEDQKPTVRRAVEDAYVAAFNDMNKTAIGAGEVKPLTFANITGKVAKLVGGAQDAEDAASRISAQIDLKVGTNGKVSPEVELLQDIYERLTGEEHPSIARVQEIQNQEKANAKPSVVQQAAKTEPAASSPVPSAGPSIPATSTTVSSGVSTQPTASVNAQAPAISRPGPSGVVTPAPQLVTVTRQGKQVQLPKETIAKDLAKALTDPKKAPIIQDVTGTESGNTMTFREAAVASLTRQKKPATEKAVENERKRIHKMLAGLGITEAVVDKVSAMDVADSPELAEVSNDPESGVSIQNSPNSASTEEHLTAEQARRQAEADKIMKEQADVKTPEVTTAAEQEVERAIEERRRAAAEATRQRAIAEAARSPYANEVREDWDDMPDVIDGVTPKFDQLTMDERAALVTSYEMYKNDEISYRDFEEDQRDIARAQETVNGRNNPAIPEAPVGLRNDVTGAKSSGDEGNAGVSQSGDNNGTENAEGGSPAPKAPVIALKKKRVVAKPEEKKSTPQTETETFKKWFGDSKVVDKDGDPLVVYHGTRADFDVFRTDGYSPFGEGAFFTSDPGTAEAYANSAPGAGPARIIPVYLRITGEGDGTIKDGGLMGTTYTVKSPSQIKSAIGNNGKFDANNPSITDAAQDFKDAMSDLGDILTKVGRANLTPEQDKDLLGVLTKLVGAAIRMGYSSLEQATRFVLDSVKKKFGAKAVPVTPARVKTAYQSSSIIERNVSKLPPSLQGPAFIAATNIKDLVQKGIFGLSFGHDLAAMVEKTLPSAKQFFDTMSLKESTKNRLEIEIDKIATEAYKVPDQAALNKFLKTSTRSQKWGYQPSWHEKVDVDPTSEAAYNKLSKQSQSVADKIFHHGWTSRNNMISTIREEINSGFDEELKHASEADKAKIQEKRKAEMHLFDTQFNSFKGPYAPLSRFGEYVTVAKSQARLDAEKKGDTKWLNKEGNKPENYLVSFHDTLGAAKWAAKQLESQYASTVGAPKQAYAKGMSEAPWSALRRLKLMVNEHYRDAPEDQKKALQHINNMLKDLYLSQLSEAAARKHDLKRRDIEGASDDMLRAFASKGKADAHFMSALQHTGKVQDALNEMRNEAHGTDETRAGRADRTNVFNEILGRYAGSMDYRPTPVQDKLLMLNSVWQLLLRPAYYLQNATQTWAMSLPILAGRHGNYFKAAGAVSDAYSDLADGFGKDSAVKGFISGEFDIDAMPIKADEKAALKKLLELGILDIGLQRELGYFESRGGLSQPAVDATHKLSTLVKSVETANRVTAALAAYRLAGGGTKGLEEAKYIVRTTHGDYSGFNAPSLYNKLPKLVVQFRKFQIIQLSIFARLVNQSFKGETKEVRAAAKASFTYMMGHYFVMAGALGMPAMSTIGMVMAAAFGDDEEPEDFELMARRAIGDEDIADILLKGAPTLAGMDLSGMLGAGNVTSILPFTDVKLDSKKGYAETMLGLLGPALGATGPKIAEGIGYMQRGDLYRGFERVLPNGLTNALKAYREATQGASNKLGDMTLSPEEISLWDTFLTSMSIRSQTTAKAQFLTSQKIEFENFYKERTAEIRQRYVRAWEDGDGDTMADMRTEWQDVQMSKARNGFAKQPLSDLTRAPREQQKRERNTQEGVQFNRNSRGFVRQAAEL